MAEFMNNKINIGSVRHLIDWDALPWHRRQLSPQRRATRLKDIYRWAPPNTRNVETRQGDDPICPLYQAKHKTTQHFMECAADNSREHRRRATEELENTLATKSPCPHLVTLVILAVTLPGDKDLQVHTTEQGLQQLSAKQEAIG